jgi:hypothetical protein
MRRLLRAGAPMKNTRGLTLAASLALALIFAGVGFAAGLSAKQHSLETERVVLDNARVRVLEYTSKPHGDVCGVGTHSHPAHVTIVLSPARDRATTVGGKPEVSDMKVGDVYWSDGETHTDVNVGKSNSRLIVVELK